MFRVCLRALSDAVAKGEILRVAVEGPREFKNKFSGSTNKAYVHNYTLEDGKQYQLIEPTNMSLFREGDVVRFDYTATSGRDGTGEFRRIRKPTMVRISKGGAARQEIILHWGTTQGENAAVVGAASGSGGLSPEAALRERAMEFAWKLWNSSDASKNKKPAEALVEVQKLALQHIEFIKGEASKEK